MKALPCPFCGQAAKVSRQPASPPEVPAPYWQCGCGDTHRTRLCAVHPLAFGDSRAEAIATWNTRSAVLGESAYRDRARRTFQPIVWETRADGTPRVCFKKNEIVDFLLRNGGFDLNALARMDFSDADRAQFAQLIGYSVSGYGELSYVPLAEARVADALADEMVAAKDGGAS